MTGDFLGYIAALDIGTTNIRCQIIDQQAQCRGSYFDRIKLHYPEPNSVEIDPNELWTSVVEVVKNAIKDANISVRHVKSLAIATQRATFTTWGKNDGEALHNFITWKDLRAADLIRETNKSWKMMVLRAVSFLVHFVTRQSKFGLVSNLKFTSNHVTIRLLWLIRSNEKVKQALAKDNLMFGTMDTWLIYKFTGGKTYVTDISNASATGLYDPFSQCWSFIPKYFNIPLSILPPVVANDHDFGETSGDIFGVPVKIGAMMADQSASMYGSCCLKKDDLKLSLGTGAFLNLNTGHQVLANTCDAYPLVGWRNKSELVYLTEVACSDAGSLVQWMLSIGLTSSPENLSDMANSIEDNGEVYFVPAFSGLGSPINDESAASGFIGIKPSTKRVHIVRAVLESIVYKTVLAYDLLMKESNQTYKFIRLDGGVSRNNFICQLLADLTSLKVERMRSEMAILGVAQVAGQTCGFWKSTEEVWITRQVEGDIFTPTELPLKIQSLRLNLENWKKAARRFTSWYN